MQIVTQNTALKPSGFKKKFNRSKSFEDISKFTYDHYQLMMVSELRSPFTSIFTHIDVNGLLRATN